MSDPADRQEERWGQTPPPARSVVPRLLWGAAAALLTGPYAAGARIHRFVYEAGIRPQVQLPCAVVAVGSPLVGGTGKTPFVAWLGSALHRRGRRVAILSRGYGRRSRGLVVVSDGDRVLEGAERAGDEPLWLSARCPGVPVIVCEDRAEAGRLAHTTFGVDTVLLDDGLQHHALARDVSVATLDADYGLGNGRGLPLGPLREPLSMLGRADVLAVWGDAFPAADAERIERAAPGLKRLQLERCSVSLRVLGRRESTGLETLRGQSVGLLSGIANPARLRASVEALGARVVAERRFGDHHRYRRRDLGGLGSQTPIWLTSEKDAVKLRASWAQGVEIRVLGSAVEVPEAEAFLSWLEARLARKSGAAGPLPAVVSRSREAGARAGSSPTGC